MMNQPQSNDHAPKGAEAIFETHETVVLDLATLEDISGGAPIPPGDIIIMPKGVCPPDITRALSLTA